MGSAFVGPEATMLRTLSVFLVLSAPAAAAGAKDPLPDGARLRLGSTRYRLPVSARPHALTPDGKTVVSFAWPDWHAAARTKHAVHFMERHSALSAED